MEVYNIRVDATTDPLVDSLLTLKIVCSLHVIFFATCFITSIIQNNMYDFRENRL